MNSPTGNCWKFSNEPEPSEMFLKRIRGSQLISYLSNQLTLSNSIVSFAIILYQRYMSVDKECEDFGDTAVGCLFLGSKLMNRTVRIGKLTHLCTKLNLEAMPLASESAALEASFAATGGNWPNGLAGGAGDKTGEKVIEGLEEDWKHSILYHEEIIANTLKYDFHVDSPFQELKRLIKKYDLEHLQKFCFCVMNDLVCSKLCVVFEGRLLAYGCIFVVFECQDLSFFKTIVESPVGSTYSAISNASTTNTTPAAIDTPVTNGTPSIIGTEINGLTNGSFAATPTLGEEGTEEHHEDRVDKPTRNKHFRELRERFREAKGFGLVNLEAYNGILEFYEQAKSFGFQ